MIHSDETDGPLGIGNFLFKHFIALSFIHYIQGLKGKPVGHLPDTDPHRFRHPRPDFGEESKRTVRTRPDMDDLAKLQGLLQACKGRLNASHCFLAVFFWHQTCSRRDMKRQLDKGGNAMKSTMKERLMYTGVGIGLVLFAVFGLLYGSFLGGVVGLKMVGAVMGEPVASGIIVRIVVSISMVLGVLIPGFLVTAAGGTAGWLIGALADSMLPAPKVKMVTTR